MTFSQGLNAGSRLGVVERTNAHLVVSVNQNSWVLVTGVFISAASDQSLGLLSIPWRFSELAFVVIFQNAVAWILGAVAFSRYTLLYIVLQDGFVPSELNDRALRRRKREESLVGVLRDELRGLARASLWLVGATVVLVLSLVIRVVAVNGWIGA